MACDVGWSSHASGTTTTANGMEAECDDCGGEGATALCAASAPCGACTPTMRAGFYALGIPLSEPDPSCVVAVMVMVVALLAPSRVAPLWLVAAKRLRF
jgi:hypothetical protein